MKNIVKIFSGLMLIGALTITTSCGDKFLEEVKRDTISSDYLNTPEGLASFAIGVLSLLIALNWWLSYKLFTRSQVIQPKFRLL